MRKNEWLMPLLVVGLSLEVGFQAWRNHELRGELEQLKSTSSRPGATPRGDSEIAAETGRKATPFQLESAAGQTLAIGTGPQFLVFFSTTCPACELDAPTWGELYRDYAAANVDFVGVCVHAGETSAQSFAAHWDLGFPVVAEAGPEIIDAYGADYLPKRVLIDAGGQIVWADAPGSPLGQEGEARMREILEQMAS